MHKLHLQLHLICQILKNNKGLVLKTLKALRKNYLRNKHLIVNLHLKKQNVKKENNTK
jgi:hypothetical protein